MHNQMEMGRRALLGLVLIIAAIISGSHAQTMCGMPYTGLMACKPAATPPNPPAPNRACCTALSHADLNCLCRYKSSRFLPSIGVDPNLAEQLPEKCHIAHPAHC